MVFKSPFARKLEVSNEQVIRRWRRLSQRAVMGMYHTWVVLFAIGGTLAAFAVAVIDYGFISATSLILTANEWLVVSGFLYILAILLFLGGQKQGTR